MMTDMSNGRTAVIMIAGLAIGIIAGVFAGQWIFDSVFRALHPDTSDFWQNLVTLAVAAILTLIVGAVAFGIVIGIFYGVVFLFTSKSRRRNRTSTHD
jgi:MFS family permease